MSRELATIVLTALGATLVIASLLFFLRPRWLLGWLKGMLVFGILLFGLYTLAIAINVSGYQSLSGMQTVASIGTTKQAEKIWRVTLEPVEGHPLIETVRGDQWQVDARIIRFSGPLRWLGVAPGYRLERLSGRFASLELERSAPRTVIGLSENRWPDLWSLEQDFDLPFIEGIYGNATFMPMRDGAVFDIRLSASGLVAVPMNEQARQAVRLWSE